MSVKIKPCWTNNMRDDKGKSFDLWSFFLIIVLVVLVVFVWEYYPLLKQSGFDFSLVFPSLSDFGSSISSGIGKFGGH
jgi:hypothetical protein